jgi:GNAT superfamily N-acetyltransferase
MIRLDLLTPDEGARLGAIRLRALQDAPDAFSATIDDAAARTLDGWTKQVVDLPTFVAVSDGADVGMVRCARDAIRTDTAWLISMWVAPEMRRQGVGGALVEAVVGWARANGASRMVLDVADHNTPAIELYARKGFVPTGVTGTMPPPRAHVGEHQRELRL